MSPRKWFFIVNPAAGNGLVQKRWPGIQAILDSLLWRYEVGITKHRGHAAELAREAVRKGFRYIAAVGGDGTNNEVVNGLIRQKTVPLHEIVYTLLPIGTGNDWIRTHGIPRDLKQWLFMVVREHTVLQDVGVVQYQSEGETQTRYFVNVAGLAYDAYVVRFAEQRKSKFGGRLVYLALIVYCLLRYKLSKATVRFDGQEETGYFYTINGGICRYSGGGMQVVPHAQPSDRLLALTLARRLSKLGVLLNTWRFYNASIGKHPKVSLHQVKTIEVDSAGPEPVWVEADGEFLGQTPVILYIAQEKLRVLTPE